MLTSYNNVLALQLHSC